MISDTVLEECKFHVEKIPVAALPCAKRLFQTWVEMSYREYNMPKDYLIILCFNRTLNDLRRSIDADSGSGSLGSSSCYAFNLALLADLLVSISDNVYDIIASSTKPIWYSLTSVNKVILNDLDIWLTRLFPQMVPIPFSKEDLSEFSWNSYKARTGSLNERYFLLASKGNILSSIMAKWIVGGMYDALGGRSRSGRKALYEYLYFTLQKVSIQYGALFIWNIVNMQMKEKDQWEKKEIRKFRDMNIALISKEKFIQDEEPFIKYCIESALKEINKKCAEFNLKDYGDIVRLSLPKLFNENFKAEESWKEDQVDLFLDLLKSCDDGNCADGLSMSLKSIVTVQILFFVTSEEIFENAPSWSELVERVMLAEWCIQVEFVSIANSRRENPNFDQLFEAFLDSGVIDIFKDSGALSFEDEENYISMYHHLKMRRFEEYDIAMFEGRLGEVAMANVFNEEYIRDNSREDIQFKIETNICLFLKVLKGILRPDLGNDLT
ncbi:MAG TPA: hypothetical protein PKA63_10165 [Oligoflexia bacterium]|nr:hypothetical protein [Oligoflexia bacterium]HMP49021.1 hypothetical protein [Oligoflexia bacterium]